MTNLSNVHEAMQAAILESEHQSNMVPASLKLPKHIKDQADEICFRHGVTLSAFLRHCASHLVQDYGGMSDS